MARRTSFKRIPVFSSVRAAVAHLVLSGSLGVLCLLLPLPSGLLCISALLHLGVKRSPWSCSWSWYCYKQDYLNVRPCNCCTPFYSRKKPELWPELLCAICEYSIRA